MDLMFWAGTACWVIELVFLFWFLYECRDETTTKGFILKGGVSLNIVLYGALLIGIHNYQEGTRPSEASVLFMVGLLFTFLGDMGLATMQRGHGGSSKALFSELSSDQRNIQSLTIGVVGVLFIISFFFELVAFIKGIHGNVNEYVVPFILMFLLPILFALIGGMLTKFRLPELSMNIFIIAVFFILLTSALFSAISVYAFWEYSSDPRHAAYIFVADALFALSVLMLCQRYSRPDLFDTRPMRAVSRMLNFLSRMMLAGCAFVF